MSENLLSEYQRVLKELEMIKNKAVVIKNITQDRLKCAKNEEEKENIFIDFKNQLYKIKKDKNIKLKYKNLIKKKEMLETEMREKMSDERKYVKKIESSDDEDYNVLPTRIITSNVNDEISNLINKYKKNKNFKVSSHEKYITNKDKYNQKKIHMSNSDSSNDNNHNIIVNIPNNSTNICNNFNNEKNDNISCNISKKNPYTCSSELSSSDDDNKQTKQCSNDTQQVKKLYNLIKDLQCEIDN